MDTHDCSALQCGSLVETSGQGFDDEWSMLERWMRSKTELAFVYSRSLGGFMQTGRGVVSGLDPEYLELRTAGSTAIIVLRNARFSHEPQAFFSPSLTSSRLVPGVSISLENNDWLFFSAEAGGQLLSHGHALPGP